MPDNILSMLATNDNAIIALLSFIVISLSSVIIKLWITIEDEKKRIREETVPKWVWDSRTIQINKQTELLQKIDTIVERDIGCHYRNRKS